MLELDLGSEGLRECLTLRNSDLEGGSWGVSESVRLSHIFRRDWHQLYSGLRALLVSDWAASWVSPRMEGK